MSPNIKCSNNINRGDNLFNARTQNVGSTLSSSCSCSALDFPCQAAKSVGEVLQASMRPLETGIDNLVKNVTKSAENVANVVTSDVVAVTGDISTNIENISNEITSVVLPEINNIENILKNASKAIITDIFNIPIVRYTIYGVVIAIAIILLLIIITFVVIAKKII